jgi:hypothetical protein
MYPVSTTRFLFPLFPIMNLKRLNEINTVRREQSIEIETMRKYNEHYVFNKNNINIGKRNFYFLEKI